MANSGVSKAARKAAREAAAAAQEELARRQKANVEDLAKFFSAKHRADEVDDWLAEGIEKLKASAAQKRDEQRAAGGAALKAMRDRGETVREIARMAGVGEKTVRELIKLAGEPEATPAATPAAQWNDGAPTPAAEWTEDRPETAAEDAHGVEVRAAG
ncbi:hypothetical protein [Mycobacterium aquaticum]|uniref:Helix-turn-helix domain-containing protein n=1 Tax=Mycobacterium aquaticum TaxID=1927124 RepID=A0A1X0AGY5_9MYCO|nr:hypothetical protein [Mycobacterium aquaticum]ORA29304.1 hypothetical protein BST13_27370 [Mycobacterium aquaticum]